MRALQVRISEACTATIEAHDLEACEIAKQIKDAIDEMELQKKSKVLDVDSCKLALRDIIKFIDTHGQCSDQINAVRQKILDALSVKKGIDMRGSWSKTYNR